MDENKLDELLALTKDNNRMLRAMRRDAFVGGILKIIWWIAVVVVLPYLIYMWYLAPYLEQMITAYQQVEGQSAEMNTALEQLKSAGNIPGLNGILEQLGWAPKP